MYLETGRTPLINDFISKKNTKFSAYLQRDGADAKFVFEERNRTGASGAVEVSGEDAPPPTEAPPPPGEF